MVQDARLLEWFECSGISLKRSCEKSCDIEWILFIFTSKTSSFDGLLGPQRRILDVLDVLLTIACGKLQQTEVALIQVFK